MKEIKFLRIEVLDEVTKQWKKYKDVRGKEYADSIVQKLKTEGVTACIKEVTKEFDFKFRIELCIEDQWVDLGYVATNLLTAKQWLDHARHRGLWAKNDVADKGERAPWDEKMLSHLDSVEGRIYERKEDGSEVQVYPAGKKEFKKRTRRAILLEAVEKALAQKSEKVSE